jgi:hypothetical protein
MLNEWEKVARELGDYDMVQVCKDFETYGEMARQNDEDRVGDWLPSEPTAKEILRLRQQVEVLKRVVAAAEPCCDALCDIARDGHCEYLDAWFAALDAAGKELLP